MIENGVSCKIFTTLSYFTFDSCLRFVFFSYIECDLVTFLMSLVFA